MAAASVEGGSSGNCFSERAWAEQRRVKGTGRKTRWAPCRWFRAPLLDALLEHPMSPPPRYAAGLETGTTTLASAKVAYVPGPREGIRPPGSQGAWVAS